MALLKQASDAEIDAEGFIWGVIHDLERSGLTQKEKVLFRFVDRVNGNSRSITELDIETLHAADWDDEAIYYAIIVCAFQFLQPLGRRQRRSRIIGRSSSAGRRSIRGGWVCEEVNREIN